MLGRIARREAHVQSDFPEENSPGTTRRLVDENQPVRPRGPLSQVTLEKIRARFL